LLRVGCLATLLDVLALLMCDPDSLQHQQFQIIRYFGFSKYTGFIMHLNIYYV
jgi:hypothetical protein